RQEEGPGLTDVSAFMAEVDPGPPTAVVWARYYGDVSNDESYLTAVQPLPSQDLLGFGYSWPVGDPTIPEAWVLRLTPTGEIPPSCPDVWVTWMEANPPDPPIATADPPALSSVGLTVSAASAQGVALG